MNENAENLLIGNLKRMLLQTEEWIHDIKFYEEELNFLNSIIAEKISAITTIDLERKEIYRNMDAVLFKLSEGLIHQIKMHANNLSELIDEEDISNNHKDSRNHIHLFEKMTLLKKSIKNLKKALFRFIKNHPFKFDFDEFLDEI